MTDLTKNKYGYEKCGEGPKTGDQHRTLGGRLAKPHSQPWVAHFYFQSSYLCGGAVISRWHVLSAAHCNHGFSYAVLGDHNIQIEDGEEHYKIKKWHDNPKAHWLQLESGPVINDFAIAELILPVIFTDFIKPVCLPTRRTTDYEAKNVTRSGWGTTKWKGKYPHQLRTTSVTVLSDSQCRAAWNKYWGRKFKIDYNSSILLCSAVARRYEKDSCKGGSGGMR